MVFRVLPPRTLSLPGLVRTGTRPLTGHRKAASSNSRKTKHQASPLVNSLSSCCWTTAFNGFSRASTTHPFPAQDFPSGEPALSDLVTRGCGYYVLDPPQPGPLMALSEDSLLDYTALILTRILQGTGSSHQEFTQTL